MLIEHICVLLSRMTARPVKIALSRMKEFSVTLTHNADVIRVKMGVNQEGTLTAIESNVLRNP
jgi:CO/xanthine dehydrogenase Mo-binding subunit